MNRIYGLPAHPLLVHIPIVLIPLMALVVIAFVVRPRWRPALAAPLLLLAAATFAGSILAANSGEYLRDHVDKTALVRQHAGQGDQLKSLAILFSLAVLGLVIVDLISRRWSDRIHFPWRRQFILLASIVTLLLGGFAVAWDVQAGHSGAKAVWSERGRSGDVTGQSAPPPAATVAR